MCWLVSLDYKLVVVATLRLLGGRLVGVPPCCGKLGTGYESRSYLLLCLGIGIRVLVTLGTISVARLFIDGIDYSALGAEFARYGFNIGCKITFSHKRKKF